MATNFLHLLSQNSAIISINGHSLGLIDNKNVLEFDIISNTDKVFINYCPILHKTNSIGYTFELNTKNKPFSDNEYIEVIPFPNNHYDIIMKPFYYYQIADTEVILNQNLGKFFVSITSNNSSKISIYSGTSIVYETTTAKLISAKAEIKKDLIIVQGLIDSDNYYLLIIDTTDFHVVFSDIVQSIDEMEDYIQSLKNLNDLSHHSLVCKVNFSDKTSQKYHVYENNTMTFPLSPFLIPQDFLECIKNNDETKMKKYLTNNLSNTPFDKFKNYFGTIENIFFNRHCVLQDKLNYTIKTNNSFKNYNFIMNNNLIYDIEEVF